MIKLIIALAVMSSVVHAGIKEDFIEIVKKQCGKSQEDAEKMATPGRSGNVMALSLCKSDSIDIEGCKINCVDASSKIGK